VSLVIDVKVVPSSGRQKCILDKSGQLKCYLKSQPEKGKANEELISLFAKALGVPKDFIAIMFGLTSPKKRLKINKEITIDALLLALGIETQLSID